jgi:hypothetical protein
MGSKSAGSSMRSSTQCLGKRGISTLKKYLRFSVEPLEDNAQSLVPRCNVNVLKENSWSNIMIPPHFEL